jgi:hypothetical protein
LPFDVIRASDALDVELDLLPTGASSSADCEPTDPMLVGSLTFLTCEQRYDELGLPAPDGSLRAMKIVVPLRTTPSDGSGEDLSGARLLVICRSRVWAPLKEVTTLWTFARSVHAY